MFNNLVNRHDFTRLIWGLRHGYLPRILSRLTKGKASRVKDRWKEQKKKTGSWYQIPAVVRHWNCLITGDENINFCDYFCSKYLAGKNNLRGLAPGCGAGQKVIRWAEKGIFEKIDAYDISESRIRQAREEAKKRGLEKIINFTAGDVYSIDTGTDAYDVVMAEHCLHHFSKLKEILLKINKSLRAGGFLAVDEYIGPSRFQWTPKQLKFANMLRSSLPGQLRKHITDGKDDRKIIRPSRLSMILKDPSEAVESAKIRPLLNEIFEAAEFKGYHGAILHLLFDGIAENFLKEDETAKQYLEFCIQTENALTASGQVEDDFAVIVCRKKPR